MRRPRVALPDPPREGVRRSRRGESRGESTPSRSVVAVRRPGGPWLGRTRRQTSARLASRSRPAGVEQIVGPATTQSVPGGVGSCFPFTKEELSAVSDRRTASARPLPVTNETVRKLSAEGAGQIPELAEKL